MSPPSLDDRCALFDTTTRGYRDLLAWLEAFGDVGLVGVEGTGTHGAGLTRHLHDAGVTVIEVDRPNRQRRRRAGKSDTTDAISAARAALSGEASTAAKTRDGNVEKIRVLRIARRSIVREWVRAINALRALTVTAPPEIRDRSTGSRHRRLPSRRPVPGRGSHHRHRPRAPGPTQHRSRRRRRAPRRGG